LLVRGGISGNDRQTSRFYPLGAYEYKTTFVIFEIFIALSTNSKLQYDLMALTTSAFVDIWW
jgi:hypothetical protein